MTIKPITVPHLYFMCVMLDKQKFHWLASHGLLRANPGLFCCYSSVCNRLSQFLFLSLSEFLYAVFLIASKSNLGCLVCAKHRLTLSCQWKIVKHCLRKGNFCIHYRKEWCEKIVFAVKHLRNQDNSLLLGSSEFLKTWLLPRALLW